MDLRQLTALVTVAEGEVLIERARRALHELDQARAEIRPEPAVVTGIVTIGVLESVVDLLVEPLVRAVTERHPGIELRIVTAYSGHLQQWLDAGDVDLSLLYNLAGTPSLAVVPLLEERLWAVAPPDAGLTAGEQVAWAEVLRQPLILPVQGHGLRTLIEQARAAVEVEPRIAIQVNSMQLQKTLVLAGQGWTVLPAAGVAREVAQGVLSGAPVADPATSRALVLGLQRGTRTPPPVEAVAAELVRVVPTLVGSGAWPSARLG